MLENTGFQHFLILLYKGAILRKRHYIVTIFEIVIPVLIASIGPIIVGSQCHRSMEDTASMEYSPKVIDPKFYKPVDPFVFQTGRFSSYDLHFVYAPNDTVTADMMASSLKVFREKSGYRYISPNIEVFNSEAEMEKYCNFLLRNETGINILGTIFHGLKGKDGTLSNYLDYTIRYGDGYSSQFMTDAKYRTDGPSSSNGYMDTPFTSWQMAVEESFILKKAEAKGQTLNHQMWLQRFPYPKHLQKGFSILTMLSFLLTYSYFIFLINMIRRIIEEKSNGSKELLKMMGMSDFMYWISTFINYFVVALLTTLIITIIYKAPSEQCQFIKHTDFGVMFIMLLLYLTQSILFGMLFSIFFNKGIFAIIVYIIVHEVSFPLMAVQIFMLDVNLNYLPISLSGKLGICLLPDGALLTLCNFLSFYDSVEKGILWSNLTEFYATADLSVSMTLGMMVLSCLLYVVLIWYLDAVWPWQPGVPKPYYFMFTKSYWNIMNSEDSDEALIVRTENNQFFEPEPRGVNAGVVIKNLSKEFRTGLQTKMAVNDVSLNIFQGQITALLGHNGAGKTTTINILTGLYTPTRGTASINGLDILKNTNKARRGLGVCPQHNVLFDTLTAEEHLKIYAALKGVPWKELGNEAEKTLTLLKLLDKRNELVKTLSGGMKRKLSLGIAIIGGSKVLFLDEPTSGMDVEARRGVWDTLKEIRLNRTIILTTHYMEEADILGDRIAIMAEGEIQCCGSPMFLKQKFGTGYHLHVVKGESFDLGVFTRFLTKHMPSASIESENQTVANFKLSSNSDSGFGKMFEEMEKKDSGLGTAFYGITVTTMEDVFLKVADLSDIKYKTTEEEQRLEINGEIESVLETSNRQEEVPKGTLLLRQMLAIFLKRAHFAKRHWTILLIQLVLPFIFFCICIYICNSVSGGSMDSKNPALKLDLETVYGDKTDSFYHARKPQVQDIALKFKAVLEGEKARMKDVADPTPYILDYGKDISRYWMKLLVGGMTDLLSNGTKNLTAWYNGEPYHALPMSINLMHNALLKTIDDSASIALTNSPLSKKQSYNSFDSSSFTRQMAAIFIPLALAFPSGCFVLLPISERVSKAKLLQLMSGIPKIVYWVVMFAWDYLVHFVLSVVLILPFAIFSSGVFFSPHPEAIGSTFLLMLFYGWAIIPFSYLISLIFKKGNTGFSVIVTISSIFGVGLVSVLSSLGLTFNYTPYTIVDVIIWMLRLLPPFSASVGFSNLFGVVYSNALCESISEEELQGICQSSSTRSWNTFYKCCRNLCQDDCLEHTNPLTWDKIGSGRDVFFLALDGFLFFGLLFMIESNLISAFCRSLKRQVKDRRNRNVIIEFNQQQDHDVTMEKERVLAAEGTGGGSGQDALVSVNLAKNYSNFYAVDHLTFGIHRQECFGLLGVNGAGKTTTFKMLTGDCSAGEGNAFIQNYSLSSDLEKFQSFLGYCPQFDALIGRLTGREMLSLFGRLRGLIGYELENQVNKMIRLTDLTKHADKPCEVYSGGNKRKLSIGMALIAFPPLILLDEPTAGVDPVSRRKIWGVLAKARNEAGSAVLLTTHSMEETEALCDRLAIMVNGQLRCLGSIQHLKSKFGQGYTLKIKMKSELQDNAQVIESIKSYIQNGLRGAHLKDEHQGMLQYQVVDTSVTLSHLFNFMASMKSQYSLEDYLISETTLEQIFLTFAKDQRITAQ